MLDNLAGLGLETAHERTLRPGFDVVVDCTGRSNGLLRAIELVRPRATMVLKSTAAAATPMNLAPIVVNEISVIGSRCGRSAPALSALASGRLDPRPLISAILPLDDGIRAMELAATPPNFKILSSV
ncbi:MAG: zinc-binding dehydrogenase [Candidatus Binataceae bacterium]